MPRSGRSAIFRATPGLIEGGVRSGDLQSEIACCQCKRNPCARVTCKNRVAMYLEIIPDEVTKIATRCRNLANPYFHNI